MYLRHATFVTWQNYIATLSHGATHFLPPWKRVSCCSLASSVSECHSRWSDRVFKRLLYCHGGLLNTMSTTFMFNLRHKEPRKHQSSYYRNRLSCFAVWLPCRRLVTLYLRFNFLYGDRFPDEVQQGRVIMQIIGPLVYFMNLFDSGEKAGGRGY